MTFATQKILWLLAGLIPVVWLSRMAWTAAGTRMRSFGVAGLAARGRVRSRARRDRVAVAVAMAGIVVALAGPRSGFDEVEVQSSGADIFVAIDLSTSMMATDIRPSRFDRARREVFDLIEHVRGSGRADRVGLIGFAGVSFVQCPLTADMNAVREYLMLMNPSNMPAQGTDLGGAVMTALGAMDAGGVGPDVAAARAIVLISDGEDLEGEAAEAVKEARSRGVRIFTVGVGTEAGAPVPDGRGGFKIDRGGNTVISRFSGESLGEIARETDGEFIQLEAGSRIKALDFVAILGETVHESGKVKLWHERFQWPLAVALVAVSALLFPAWRGVSTALVAGVLAGGLVIPGQADAMAGSTRERMQTFNDGIDAYERGDYEKAREFFDRAAKGDDDEVGARSWYNAGNASVGAGNLDGAEKAYEEALRINPGDKQAAENLAWVREQKNQQEKKQQDQTDQGEKDQQQQGTQDEPGQKAGKEDEANQQRQQGDRNQESQAGKSAPEKQPDGRQSEQKGAQEKEPDARSAQQRQLTREEAERLLNSVDDLKSKYLYFVLPKDQQEKAAQPPERDW